VDSAHEEAAGAEQQFEVAVADQQAALQVADAVLGAELALKALERGAQQPLHQRERSCRAPLRGFTADDADRAEQLLIGIAQQEHVGAVIAIDRLGEAVVTARRTEFLRERFLDEPVELRRVDAVVQPDRQAHAVVDRNRLRPRHQHLDELAVRIEGRCADRRRLAFQRLSENHRGILAVVRSVLTGPASSLIDRAPILDLSRSLARAGGRPPAPNALRLNIISSAQRRCSQFSGLTGSRPRRTSKYSAGWL
jgi:hypothetical protein